MVEVKLLKQSDLLKGLDNSLLEKIAQISQSKVYAAEQVLFEHRTKIDRIYMVLRGEVELFLPLAEGRQVKLHQVQPGELFGFSAILPAGCYTTFAAKALAGTELIEISGSLLKQLMEESPEYGFELSKVFLQAYSRKKKRQTFAFIASLAKHPGLAPYLR